MKKILVTGSRVMHRNSAGALKVGYSGDEMVIPNAVYERNKRQCDLLEDLGEDPPEIASARTNAVTAQGGKDAVMDRTLRHRQRSSVRERRVAGNLPGTTVGSGVVAKSEIEQRLERQKERRREATKERLERQEKLKQRNVEAGLA